MRCLVEKNTLFLGVLAIISIITNILTPMIAVNKIDELLTSECDNELVCCSGKNNYPNFIIGNNNILDLYISDLYISDLYISINDPESIYESRLIFAPLCITLMPFICVCICIDTSYSSKKIRFCVILAILISGGFSSFAYMFNGNKFPYQFRSINDSNIFIKSTPNNTINNTINNTTNLNKFEILENIKFYKIYGSNDCGQTPINTNIINMFDNMFDNLFDNSFDESFEESSERIKHLKSNVRRLSSNGCNQEGAILYANNNFTGIFNSNGNITISPGPWVKMIIFPSDNYQIDIQEGIYIIPECEEKIKNIIIFDSGNLFIPIVYFIFCVVVSLTPINKNERIKSKCYLAN